jgi:hypothetical protein
MNESRLKTTRSASWNAGMLHELYSRKEEFPLDGDLLARINEATLSADTLRFLGMVVLWRRPRHIFEFGSGLSTLLFARLQQTLCVTTHPAVMSIDHSQRLLAATRRALGPGHNVFLHHAPLAVTECGGRVFTTYHPEYTREIGDGVRFDLVLIGGPPAYRYGREAPLYHLAPYLSKDALIILDKANREPEQEALRHWQEAWPGCLVGELFPGCEQGLAIVSIGESAPCIPEPENQPA